MKTKHFIVCFSLVLLVSLFVGCTNPMTNPNGDTSKNSSTTAIDTSSETAVTLTKEDACSIALSHAGFSADQVTFLQADYDWDNGIPHYEVEFYKDKTQYDYNIHAKTGEILSTENEWND